MTVRCDIDGQTFENEMELAEHANMAHDAKWTGNINQSENGDLNADGAVSALTSDTIGSRGGTDRPNARDRAATRQGRR